MDERQKKLEYYRIHNWISYHYGKANSCLHCGAKNTKYQYALKKGFEYERNINNYITLCISCHRKYDFDPNIGILRSVLYKGVPKPWRYKQIKKKTRQGVVLAIYNSLSEAADSNAILKTSIQNMLGGRSKSAGGFLWEQQEKMYDRK